MHNKKILLLTKYSRKGASSRLRTLQYLPYLKNYGFAFEVQSLFDDSYLDSLYKGKKRNTLAVFKLYLSRLYALKNIKNYDLIWIEKEIFPYCPALIERLMNFFGVNYIVDYDDAVFHNYDKSKNKLIKLFLSKKIDRVMQNAKIVIVGNDYLMNRAKAAGAKQVIKIPTVVNHSKYKSRVKSTEDKITIGWIGSPMTQKYIIELLPALLTVSRKHQFRLLLVGASDNIIRKARNLDIDIRPWSEDTEVNLIREMDIGIMPLKTGSWEQGKCGYKLIQYMACGLSVIATPIGVNKDIVIQSNSGQLATSSEEWIAALSKAISSKELRMNNGISGRTAVRKYYSIESQVETMVDTLNQGIGN